MVLTSPFFSDCLSCQCRPSAHTAHALIKAGGNQAFLSWQQEGVNTSLATARELPQHPLVVTIERCMDQGPETHKHLCISTKHLCISTLEHKHLQSISFPSCSFPSFCSTIQGHKSQNMPRNEHVNHSTSPGTCLPKYKN